MKKNDLYILDNTIYRVLDIQDDRLLIIDCKKRTMPKYVLKSKFENIELCTQEHLLEFLDPKLPDMKSLTSRQKEIMQKRYTMVAGVLPFLDNGNLKKATINRISEYYNISKQSLRNYLCSYLVFQDITALAPKSQNKERDLTEFEKDIRWALNKFYYTKNKNSISTAYTLLLKYKYTDQNGKLVDKYPTIHQFRYFYKKNKKMENYYISRYGITNYQRNNRPLLGNTVQEFAGNIGVGMLDSTICDIYLVNEKGDLVGRPILTACVDAYSSLCCGYALSWEGGVYSLRELMVNIITDKVELCRDKGISIDVSEWNNNQIPGTLLTDKGKEYTSMNFEQLSELGITIVNLPPYRPDLKGPVEKFFDILQSMYKNQLKGKGVIEADFQERGSKDYRKEACLTLEDFERVLLHCIIYYNSKRIINNFPYTEEMVDLNIKPYASCIFEYGKTKMGANMLNVSYEELVLTLLPRVTARFTRKGLIANGLRYKNNNYKEEFLKGGETTVSYNPENLSIVWVLDQGEYIPFELIDTNFEGKTLKDISGIKENKSRIIEKEKEKNLQAQIDLMNNINSTIKMKKAPKNIDIKNMSEKRQKEKTKNHKDFLERGGA